MGKQVHIDGIDIELDDDITEADLDNHPAPESALSDDELQNIQDDEATLGE